MKLIKQNLVIKSNKLIGMQADLNLTQLKLFAMVIVETIKNPNNEFYRFNIKDLMNKFNITDTNYTALKNATKNMIKAVVLKTSNGEHQLALFTDVIYKDWVVDMYLHTKLKPYILDIEKKYTKYYFENIAWLNSIYSVRIYELLKEYAFRKNRNFELKDLRFLLNIGESKYKNYPDFKKRVLLSAQKELKEKTDIYFEFEEIRESRKVVKLEFDIFTNKEDEILTTNENSFKTDLSSILRDTILLNDKQIQTVLKQFQEDHIKRNIEYVLSQKGIKNIPWYFMKALNDDYWKSIIQKKKKDENNEARENEQKEKIKKEEEVKHKELLEKRKKIEEYILNNEDKVIELIPDFIKTNSFLLQRTWVDTDNKEELLHIIKWKDDKYSNIRSLFIGYISKVVLGW